MQTCQRTLTHKLRFVKPSQMSNCMQSPAEVDLLAQMLLVGYSDSGSNREVIINVTFNVQTCQTFRSSARFKV